MIKSNSVLFFLLLSHWLWAQKQGWNIVNPVSESMNLNSVCFYGENEGFAVGNKGCILHTKDGGDNWEKMDSPNSKDLYGVYWFEGISCPSPAFVTALGQAGRILHSSDSGATWALASSPSVSNLYAVDFGNNLTGFAPGDGGTILKTSDGVSNWLQQYNLENSTLYAVSFLDANKGYCRRWENFLPVLMVDDNQQRRTNLDRNQSNRS